MGKLTGLELANQMGDFCNTLSMRERTQEFVDGFCRQHRTLQQSSFKMMLQLIEHMADGNYSTDGRNEQSKQVAKKLMAGFKKMVVDELVGQGYTLDKAKEYAEMDHYKPSQYLQTI